MSIYDLVKVQTNLSEREFEKKQVFLIYGLLGEENNDNEEDDTDAYGNKKLEEEEEDEDETLIFKAPSFDIIQLKYKKQQTKSYLVVKDM